MKKVTIATLIIIIGLALITLGIFLNINTKEANKSVPQKIKQEEQTKKTLKPYKGAIYNHEENGVECLAYDIENTTGQTINAKHLTLKITSKVTNEIIEKIKELTNPIKNKEKITIKFSDINIPNSELGNYLIEITLQ